MSQQQPRRPQAADTPIQEQPIRYGDVFSVSGQLARRPITPKDAAMMQSAENMVIGQTQKGGAASVMQSAATQNEKAGFVGHSDLINVDQGMSVSETDFPGGRIVSESVGGQVVGQYIEPMSKPVMQVTAERDRDPITIGEALEATALRVGDKPVDQSDAAAIQAAEVRATGSNVIVPGGVAAAAQSAANANARMKKGTEKTKLGDILTDATEKLPTDKAAMRRDAEGVMSAEIRNNPNLATHTGGVAESLVVAARLNQ